MSSHPTLFENGEYRGEWWLPGNPKERIPGILTLRNGEPRLSLLGMFAAAAESFGPAKSFSPPAIHGEASDGTAISLLATIIGTRMSFGFGPASSEYVAMYAAVGAHVLPSTKFSHLEVAFTRLDEWVALMPFAERRASSKGTPGRRVAQRIDMSFEGPAGLRIAVPSHRIALSLEYNMNSDGTHHHRVWTFENFLRIGSSVPKTLDWFLDVREDLRKLLAILIGDAVYTTRIRTSTAEKEPIYFYHEQRGVSEQPESRFGGMLFALPVLRKLGVTKLIRQAFEVLRRYKPLVDLYLGTVYPPSMFVEFEFTSLMQALESYHRRAHRGRYVVGTKFDEIKAPMLAAMPPGTPNELRQKLKDVLRFANEHSLRRRLRRIFEDVDAASYTLMSKRKPAEFANLLVDTRNALTHYPVGGGPVPLAGRSLHTVNKRLQVCCALLLLRKIGFAEDLVVARIRAHPRFRALIEPV